MMNQTLMKVGNKITRAFGKTKLFATKHSPEILLVAGTVTVIGGVIAACKETLVLDDILDEHNETINKIQNALEDTQLTAYGENEAKHDRIVTYTHTVGSIALNFAPAVGLIGAGFTMIFASYGIMHKRQVAIVAAYNALMTDFKNYRERIRQKLGDEAELAIYNGLEDVTPDEAKQSANKDVKAGDKKVVDTGNDIYRGIFKKGNLYWSPIDDYNFTFLHCQEDTANRWLAQNGHLVLNEVRSMLGLKDTKAGAVTGWTYDEHNPDKIRFNVMPSWLNTATGETSTTYEEGWERCFVLDFNVDGIILDKLPDAV